MDNLEIHADPSSMCLDGRRNPPQLERNPHKQRGEPASKQEGAGPRFKPTSITSWAEATALTAEPAYHPCYSIHVKCVSSVYAACSTVQQGQGNRIKWSWTEHVKAVCVNLSVRERGTNCWASSCVFDDFNAVIIIRLPPLQPLSHPGLFWVQ